MALPPPLQTLRGPWAALPGTVLVALLAAGPAASQQHAMPATEFVLNGVIPLFETLGPYGRAVTTANAEAQAYFNQGLRLAFAFGMHDAQQSFVAAAKKDPTCASCRWGLAWALGPYVNGPSDPGGEEIAYLQAQEAKRLAAGATPVERALIDALAVRYAAAPGAEGRAPLDRAYVAAMRDVHTRFPDDVDVATLYAESIMVQRQRDFWTRSGQPQPGVDEALAVLEDVLRRAPTHPGACHLYIHLTEGSPAPARGERCADALVGAMPGASHMQHMPSHTYVRTGRYAEAVRVNQLARAADAQAERGGVSAIYPDHNLHMLLVAASYDGQSAVAIQAARDLAQLSPTSAHQLPLVLVRFGRWQEILALPAPSDRFQAAMLAYARGLATLRTGRATDGPALLGAVDGALEPETDRDRRLLLGLASAVLGAEIDAATGRYDAAVAALAQARAVEASMPYMEPEEWVVPVRQVLGDILLKAGRPAEAETAYRGDLEAHPENGWSLYGLSRSLDAQGKAADAAATLGRFRRAWARADIQLSGSRF